MIPEKRNDDVYKKLPLRVRFNVRVIVYIMNVLNNQLKPFNLIPYFAISQRDDLASVSHLKIADEDDNGDLLQ